MERKRLPIQRPIIEKRTSLYGRMHPESLEGFQRYWPNANAGGKPSDYVERDFDYVIGEDDKEKDVIHIVKINYTNSKESPKENIIKPPKANIKPLQEKN